MPPLFAIIVILFRNLEEKYKKNKETKKQINNDYTLKKIN
jgi:hypothetical protein